MDVVGLIISFFVASATIALAVVALLTIRKGVREKRERRLDDVIELAIDIRKCSVDFDIKEIGELEGSKGDLYLSIKVGDTLIKAKDMRTKVQYMSDIAEHFGADLQQAIAKLKDEFEAHIKLLEKWNLSLIDTIRNPEETDISPEQLEGIAIEVGNHEWLLAQYVNKVIEEVNRIKNRNLGQY